MIPIPRLASIASSVAASERELSAAELAALDAAFL
jgi:hypothetical protein